MYRLSTRTHGVLDYAVGAANAALPHMMRCNRSTRRILESAGVGAGVYSMLTDYERGVLKVLPMEAHLALDAASGAGLIAAAALLRDETQRNRALLAGIGAFEIAVASMTSLAAYTEGTEASPAEVAAHRIAEFA
jgi:hypothetical protein